MESQWLGHWHRGIFSHPPPIIRWMEQEGVSTATYGRERMARCCVGAHTAAITLLLYHPGIQAMRQMFFIFIFFILVINYHFNSLNSTRSVTLIFIFCYTWKHNTSSDVSLFCVSQLEMINCLSVKVLLNYWWVHGEPRVQMGTTESLDDCLIYCQVYNRETQNMEALKGHWRKKINKWKSNSFPPKIFIFCY